MEQPSSLICCLGKGHQIRVQAKEVFICTETISWSLVWLIKQFCDKSLDLKDIEWTTLYFIDIQFLARFY